MAVQLGFMRPSQGKAPKVGGELWGRNNSALSAEERKKLEAGLTPELLAAYRARQAGQPVAAEDMLGLMSAQDTKDWAEWDRLGVAPLEEYLPRNQPKWVGEGQAVQPGFAVVPGTPGQPAVQETPQNPRAKPQPAVPATPPTIMSQEALKRAFDTGRMGAPTGSAGTAGGAGTPWAAVGPKMTNQSAIATAARDAAIRGGITNVTPFGTVLQPLNLATNYSASGLGGPNVSHTQRAEAEAAQAARSAQATNAWKESFAMGGATPRTYEAQAGRQRQLEMDKINQGLASANQQAQQNKLLGQIMGKVLPAQEAGKAQVDAAKVAAGIDPATGQPLAGARQPPQPVKTAAGVWVDEATGKPLPDNVVKQLEQKTQQETDVEAARQLPPAKAASKWNPFSADNVWGKDPTTGKFKEFPNQKALENDKRYNPLTPEEQKAHEEGNKRKIVMPAAGQAQEPGIGLASAAGPVSGVATNTVPGQVTSGTQQGQVSPEFHRAQVAQEADPARKKAMLLAAARAGQLTREQALAIAQENGIQ